MLTKKNNFTLTYTAGVSGLDQRWRRRSRPSPRRATTASRANTPCAPATCRLISASTVHETRLGYTWRYRTDTPNSTATSVQVAGSFTGGGVATQYLRTHERDLEFDDDFLLTRGKHNIKAGIELENTSLHEAIPARLQRRIHLRRRHRA